MSDEHVKKKAKSFVEYVFPAFRFGEPSAMLEWTKSLLVGVIALEIFAQDGGGQSLFIVRSFDFTDWAEEELINRAQDESGLGMWKMAHQSVMALSVDSLATKTMNETIDAGFSVYLISEDSLRHGVLGNYTLLANITDNS